MSLLKSHHATVQKLPRPAIDRKTCKERTEDLQRAAVPTADGRFASCVAPHLARSMHARSTRNCGPANPLQIDAPYQTIVLRATLQNSRTSRAQAEGWEAAVKEKFHLHNEKIRNGMHAHVCTVQAHTHTHT